MIPVRRLSIALLLVFTATGAFASWYDDYDAGINAANKGQWSTVIQKMSAAIKGSPKENDKARTYGAIFISYHPYYYRAVAYLNTGKYEQAVADLEQASGPGEENLGSIETLMSRAKRGEIQDRKGGRDRSSFAGSKSASRRRPHPTRRRNC